MPARKTRSKDRLVIWAFLILLAVFGGLVARKFLVSRPAPAPVAPPVREEPRQLREVILFFGSPGQSQLVAETREIEGCQEETECLRGTVQALVDGPAGSLVPIVPSQTALRAVAVENGTAVLDFSRDFVAAHPGGSQSELLTVYGLADTIAANFPHLRQVRILIEAEPAATIKGHVDLSRPVPADFSFTRPPEGFEQPGAVGPSGSGSVPADGRAGE